MRLFPLLFLLQFYPAECTRKVARNSTEVWWLYAKRVYMAAPLHLRRKAAEGRREAGRRASLVSNCTACCRADRTPVTGAVPAASPASAAKACVSVVVWCACKSNTLSDPLFFVSYLISSALSIAHPLFAILLPR